MTIFQSVKIFKITLNSNLNNYISHKFYNFRMQSGSPLVHKGTRLQILTTAYGLLDICQVKEP